MDEDDVGEPASQHEEEIKEEEKSSTYAQGHAGDTTVDDSSQSLSRFGTSRR